MAKVKAKPLTNPEPNQNKAPQAIKVVTLLSRILEKAYSFRFYPTPTQESLLRRTLGCVRLVYNKA